MKETTQRIEPSEAIELLYSEIPTGVVSVKLGDVGKAKKHLQVCFSYLEKSSESSKDQSSHLFRLLSEIVGTTDYKIYTLDSDNEDHHPTPGIFWEFWCLLIPAEEHRVLTVSGSACD